MKYFHLKDKKLDWDYLLSQHASLDWSYLKQFTPQKLNLWKLSMSKLSRHKRNRNNDFPFDDFILRDSSENALTKWKTQNLFQILNFFLRFFYWFFKEKNHHTKVKVIVLFFFFNFFLVTLYYINFFFHVYKKSIRIEELLSGESEPLLLLVAWWRF